MQPKTDAEGNNEITDTNSLPIQLHQSLPTNLNKKAIIKPMQTNFGPDRVSSYWTIANCFVWFVFAPF